MKKTIFITTALILTLILGCRLEEIKVDPPECMTFERLYGDESTNYSVGDISPTSDGHFIICGAANDDIFLLKINNEGETQFLKTNVIPNTGENCKSITIRPDGGFLICGEKKPIGEESGQPFFATYDAQGNFQNQSMHYELGRCDCIIQAKDGDYLYAGRIRNINNSVDAIRNTYVGRVRVSDNNPMYLDGYIPQARPVQEAAFSIIPTHTGYAVAGRSGNSPNSQGGTSPHFYILDDAVNVYSLLNEEYYDYSSQSDAALDIVETSDGNFIMTGIATLNEHIFALKVDTIGNTVSFNTHGGQAKGFGNSIIKAHEDKHYIIAGHLQSTDGTYNVYLSKINDDGIAIWEKTFGLLGIDEVAPAVLPASNCGYIIAGQRQQNELGRPYVLKVDEDGNIQ